MLSAFLVPNASASPIVNALPVLDPIPNQVVDELAMLSFTAAASDADGQSLTFSLQNAPYGASINPSTGEFRWTPAEDQGPGVYSINIMVSDGTLLSSESVLIIVNDVGGGGSGTGERGTSASTTDVPPQLAPTDLSAEPSSIPLYGTTDLTQLSDPAINGELISLMVLEPDGDICSALGLSASIPLGGLTKKYPNDFAVMSNSGDGICDTGNLGIYHAQSQLRTTVETIVDTAEFQTESPFVLPESPIGIIALVGSSLAAYGAFAYIKNKALH